MHFLLLVYTIMMECQHDPNSGICWVNGGTAVEINMDTFLWNTILNSHLKLRFIKSVKIKIRVYGSVGSVEVEAACEGSIMYWHPLFQMIKLPKVASSH